MPLRHVQPMKIAKGKMPSLENYGWFRISTMSSTCTSTYYTSLYMFMYWLFGEICTVYNPFTGTTSLCFLGSVKLLKGSVASSPREKRNARKRSFEQCLSATAAKILKLEQEREGKATGEVTGVKQRTVQSTCM